MVAHALVWPVVHRHVQRLLSSSARVRLVATRAASADGASPPDRGAKKRLVFLGTPEVCLRHACQVFRPCRVKGLPISATSTQTCKRSGSPDIVSAASVSFVLQVAASVLEQLLDAAEEPGASFEARQPPTLDRQSRVLLEICKQHPWPEGVLNSKLGTRTG